MITKEWRRVVEYAFQNVGCFVRFDHVVGIEKGLEPIAHAAPAGAFGPSTYAAVRDFQARHVGPDGHALGEDGIVGPATQWALTHPGASGKSYVANGWRFAASDVRPEVRMVLQAAVGEIGVVEQPDGSNRGSRGVRQLVLRAQ